MLGSTDNYTSIMLAGWFGWKLPSGRVRLYRTAQCSSLALEQCSTNQHLSSALPCRSPIFEMEITSWWRCESARAKATCILNLIEVTHRHDISRTLSKKKWHFEEQGDRDIMNRHLATIGNAKERSKTDPICDCTGEWRFANPFLSHVTRCLNNIFRLFVRLYFLFLFFWN